MTNGLCPMSDKSFHIKPLAALLLAYTTNVYCTEKARLNLFTFIAGAARNYVVKIR